MRGRHRGLLDTVAAGLAAILVVCFVTGFALLFVVGAIAEVAAATGKPAWQISILSQPGTFAPTNPPRCSTNEEFCDSYALVVKNMGSSTSSGTIIIDDTLPAGLTLGGMGAVEGVTCTGASTIECTTEEHVAPGEALVVRLHVKLEHEPTPSGALPADTATVTGGGGELATVSTQTTVSAEQSPFGLETFTLEATDGEGKMAQGAGQHPYAVTTNIAFPTAIDGTEFKYVPVEQEKNIIASLPSGFIGDPESTPQCPESALVGGPNVGSGINGESECPPESQIGSVVVEGNLFGALFGFEAISFPRSAVFPVYNMQPEKGYPAEFGFNFKAQPVVFYANVAPGARGPGHEHEYVVRVTSPGIIRGIGIDGLSLSIWGMPGDASHTPIRQLQGQREGGAGSGVREAFLTNPTSCPTSKVESTIQVNSWERPAEYKSKSSDTYPALSGCGELHFAPTIGVTPSTSQADEPAGYEVKLTVPQAPNMAPDVATSDLKSATITLPPGVSVSPGAADGLVGCQVTGSSGINLGSGEVDPEGRDSGDPEATELGDGHPGGNGSPYDDGLYHPARGHCPEASEVGTVEVETPVLPPHTVTGRVYIAQPSCSPCSEAQVEKGEVFGLYLEIEGDGVVVKLPGVVEVGGAGQHSKEVGLQSGQIRTTFAENPQLPFSELKLKLKDGPRAPLENPQSCGSITTTSDLTPWSSPATPDARPTSSFGVTGCEGSPLKPAFAAGTAAANAGAFSPFTLTVSRHDREQDLSGITVQMPRGLLGTIAGIPQCAEAEANAGTCPSASQIGTATAAVGAGSHPFWQSGPVYLTGPYKGGPFGLAVVVAAKAGPYYLGNVIVRAAIYVDPNTAQLTVVSDPLPQSVDGVPLRVQTVEVSANKPNFTFDPTNCAQQAITATITGSEGASAAVSSTFAAQACGGLPFKPLFSVSTLAKTSKQNGASLNVRVSQRPGEAHIGKVDVSLPVSLPSRLSTLQKACTEKQFAANPAGCPAASVVGTATATTPVLNAPLTGPAYLVSHGGAAFPDLVIVLQGEGVTIDLVGNTDIKKGITYSRFETVPDAPINTFELELPEGPHSVLGANGSLCKVTVVKTVKRRVAIRRNGKTTYATRSVQERVSEPLIMPTTIIGQNGARMTQGTKISVIGCPKAKTSKTSPKGHSSNHNR